LEINSLFIQIKEIFPDEFVVIFIRDGSRYSCISDF